VDPGAVTPAETLTVVPCAGIPITACTPEEAAHEVVRLATSPLERGVDVHLCNAYTLALADKDGEFKSLLQRAAINFPDGKAVVWANRLRHRRLDLPSDRVYGPDLFLDVFRLGEVIGLRHYLLGSTPDVLASLETQLRRRFPKACIAGTESPPFRELSGPERQAQTERIRSTGAQVIWVGLGTPKQDWEAAGLAHELPLVFIAVGAAFDFVAGAKQQAPLWAQRGGLEWAFRLALEPRRLWKRYLFGNVRFVAAAIQDARSS
jgi:N-acetylglucosaminyldiphosphoundecaprenol N-acetyl-beta-D-mannosaminyltransferase